MCSSIGWETRDGKKRGRRRKRRLDQHSLRLVCPPVLPLPLSAFRRSVSRRPNKPLMRNGCYSCPPRYFCAITIYHICLSTVHPLPHASLPPSLASFSSSFSLYFYASRGRRRRRSGHWHNERRVVVSTYPVPRVSSTFRPNHPPRITGGVAPWYRESFF